MYNTITCLEHFAMCCYGRTLYSCIMYGAVAFLNVDVWGLVCGRCMYIMYSSLTEDRQHAVLSYMDVCVYTSLCSTVGL